MKGEDRGELIRSCQVDCEKFLIAIAELNDEPSSGGGFERHKGPARVPGIEQLVNGRQSWEGHFRMIEIQFELMIAPCLNASAKTMTRSILVSEGLSEEQLQEHNQK